MLRSENGTAYLEAGLGRAEGSLGQCSPLQAKSDELGKEA